MIKVSKLADYAVVILATLAASDEAQMTAAGLALKTGLPEPTVAKVLKLLAKEDLLESIRGAGGGYRLAARPAEIRVSQIISAVDGPVSLTACVDGNTESCSYESMCPVKGRWDGVNRAIRESLERISLAEMLQDVTPAQAGVWQTSKGRMPAFAGMTTEEEGKI